MFTNTDVSKVKTVHEFLEGKMLFCCEKSAGCRDCSYINEHLTWLEQFELEEIE